MEIERILTKGVIHESFLTEEIRSGFCVSRERKTLWIVLLDILLEFDKVCREHGLKYFLSDGTLLGSVRHRGFIPWDDDIDVAMPRSDYEKLITLKDEFQEPYLLQTPYTDNGYLYSFIKIRNELTTFASSAFMYGEFNQGCFIDIFPYDSFDIQDSERLFREINLRTRALSSVMKSMNPSYSCSDSEICDLLSYNSPLQIYEQIQTIAKQAKKQGEEYVSNLVCSMTPYHKKAYRPEWFETTVEGEFEGFVFPIPIGSHEVLSTLFGDYMQFPPVTERGVNHDGSICRPEIPYVIFHSAFMKKDHGLSNK